MGKEPTASDGRSEGGRFASRGVYTAVGLSSPDLNACWRFSRSCAHIAAPTRLLTLASSPTIGCDVSKLRDCPAHETLEHSRREAEGPELGEPAEVSGAAEKRRTARR